MYLKGYKRVEPHEDNLNAHKCSTGEAVSLVGTKIVHFNMCRKPWMLSDPLSLEGDCKRSYEQWKAIARLYRVAVDGRLVV